eukprot:20571-Heterococcus_DN1.PRE.2
MYSAADRHMMHQYYLVDCAAVLALYNSRRCDSTAGFSILTLQVLLQGDFYMSTLALAHAERSVTCILHDLKPKELCIQTVPFPTVIGMTTTGVSDEKCSVLIALSAATTAVVVLLLVSPTYDGAALQGSTDVATLALADAQCSVHTH